MLTVSKLILCMTIEHFVMHSAIPSTLVLFCIQKVIFCSHQGIIITNRIPDIGSCFALSELDIAVDLIRLPVTLWQKKLAIYMILTN